MTPHLRIKHLHAWRVLALTLPVILMISRPHKNGDAMTKPVGATMTSFEIRLASDIDSVYIMAARPMIQGSCALYAETESRSYLLGQISKPGIYGYPLKKEIRRVYLFDNVNDELVLEQLIK